MIEHTVTFRLKHGLGSPEEEDFLEAAGKLAAIPGVSDFMIRRQTSAKNPHTFGISMKFSSAEDYAAYNSDPLHANFVRDRWLLEVDDFQEADFEDRE